MTDRALEIALHEEGRLARDQQQPTPSNRPELVIIIPTRPVTYEEVLQASAAIGCRPASLDDLLELSGSEEILTKSPIAIVEQPDGSNAELYQP